VGVVAADGSGAVAADAPSTIFSGFC